MMLELEHDRVLSSLQYGNNMEAQDQGYATPGHMEEHDFITAFFQNQDHDAVSLVYNYNGCNFITIIIIVIFACSLLVRRRMRPTEESREMWRTISLTSLGIVPTPLSLRM